MKKYEIIVTQKCNMQADNAQKAIDEVLDNATYGTIIDLELKEVTQQT